MRLFREHTGEASARPRRRARAALAGVIALLAAGAIVAATSGPSHPTKTVMTSQRAVASGGTSASMSQSAPGESKANLVTGDSVGASANVAAGSAGTAAGAPAAPAAPQPQPQSLTAAAGPKVVKTATMRVQVGRGRFQSMFTEASAVAGRYQGFVSDSSSQTHDKEASEGTLTLRVPADRFDQARADLAHLGKVDHVDISGQDVTAQLVDFAARIRSLQAQEQALQTLLSKARSVGEVLEVQGQLFNVRQQIEQLQAQQANLDSEASFATITVTLFEPGAAAVTPPKPEPATGLARSWHLAVHGSAAVIGGTLVVIGYLLPALALALLAWLVLRLVRRSRPAEAPVVTPAH